MGHKYEAKLDKPIAAFDAADVLRDAGLSFTFWDDHASGRIRLVISIKGGPSGYVCLEAHGRSFEDAVRRLQFVSEEMYR